MMERFQQTWVQNWVSLAALSSAILAIFAALSGVAATSHGNWVTRDLIRSSNEWSYFQAKGIKANLLQTKIEILTLSKQEVQKQDRQKLEEYKQEQEVLSERAKSRDETIQYHLKVGGLFTRGMTFFQIAIGIIAVSILTKKRLFWVGGLALGLWGLFYATQGFFA